MGITIRALYDRPSTKSWKVELPNTNVVDAIVAVLDEDDASVVMLRHEFYGTCAIDVNAETIRAAIALAAPEHLPAAKELLDFATANDCLVTIERPATKHGCEITGIRLNPKPINEPELDWCTSHATYALETLGFEVDAQNGKDYAAAEVLERVQERRCFMADAGDADQIAEVAQFAILKCGPDARIAAF